ncbi:serine protease [bacterium]|nr:serine protease [bacterium]
MLKRLSHKAKVLFILNALLITSCSLSPKKGETQAIAPIAQIENLKNVQPTLRKLQHSLVRIRLESNFGTGFFFKSRSLLVTSLHTFDSHPCLEKNKCDLILGFVKNENTLDEVTVQTQVALRDSEHDLIYLSIKDADKLAHIIPLFPATKTSNQKVTTAGFYQDEASLTFSHGKFQKQHLNETVTTMVIGHGFSGAPVVNEAGEVLGVVSSYHPLRANKNIGYARFTEVPL